MLTRDLRDNNGDNKGIGDEHLVDLEYSKIEL
jgi:hypothetical protein